jgi:hypothetical protein
LDEWQLGGGPPEDTADADLIARARTTLAQSELEGVTDQDIQEWADASWVIPLQEQCSDGDGWQICFTSEEFCDAIREALVRWGHFTIRTEGPTDEEIDALERQFWQSTGVVNESLQQEELFNYRTFLRAGLARWGRPTIKPVPAAERLPKAEDCDAENRCWWFCPAAILPSGQCAYWCLAPADGSRSWFTHWLPHHALPVPTTH